MNINGEAYLELNSLHVKEEEFSNFNEIYK